MPEYKPDQCPECGCYEFERDRRSILLFNFINGAFIIQRDLLRELGIIRCANCAVNIDNPESNKQGKIVLA